MHVGSFLAVRSRYPPHYVLAVIGLSFLLAFFFLSSTRPSRRSAVPGLTSSTLASKPGFTCDPHDFPGTLHLLAEFDQIDDASETLWQPLEPELCPPQAYSKRIRREGATGLPRSLFNRTVVVIGDSIDRNNVEYSCLLLGGKHSAIAPDTEYWPQPEITLHPAQSEEEAGHHWHPNEYSARSFPALCQVESIDLLLVNIFHFGLDEEEYFTWKDQYGPPYRTEDRVRQIAAPLVRKLGREVDVVEFASGLWDLARFGRIDDGLLRPEDDTTLRHLTVDRLAWLSKRYSHLLSVVTSACPAASALLARKLHIPADDGADTFQVWWQVPGGGSDGNKHTFYFPSWRINEVNQAITAAVDGTRGRWQLDTWGDKLYGMELYEPGNVHPHYAATAIWIEQMLYRFLTLPK